jgi:hypothetical protein
MMSRLILIVLIGSIGLAGCKKTPNTTPRYNPEQCPLCNLQPGKCVYCTGTGVCSFCEGKGKRWEGIGKLRYEAACPFCKGTGKCGYCGGSGKCYLCGGDGRWHYTGTGVPPAVKGTSP